MKTDLELKKFYNVEFGKTYKIFNSIGKDWFQLVGKTFHLERRLIGNQGDLELTVKHGDLICRVSDGSRMELNMLDDYVYEEVVPLLTPKEKEYLSNVINPFKDKVVSISKVVTVSGRSEFIKILVLSDMNEVPYENFESISLPNFKAQIMYKNLENFKRYTPKELGL